MRQAPRTSLQGVRVSIRHEALLPYEARSTGVKYGGRNSWFTIGGRPTQGLGPKSKPMKPWKYQLGRYKGQKRKW
ncbi:unnamed protein product [Prorocentrum cordatum]|uniref:Ribosomal protein L15 n=1 Tax=Prorocentrum cordatum TaxID=2364126 RepID=A0ABN9V0P4_9DINO|nr:unnamed protein product [Polarella glacialis]